MEINAVIFDLDGTVYNKKRLKCFFIWTFKWQLKLLTSLLKARKVAEGKEFENQEFFKAHVLETMVKQSSKSKAICERFIIKFMKKFVNILEHNYKAEPQIVKAIDYYFSQNIKMACLSDYNFVKERLVALKIDISKFTVLKSSEEFGALKPSPKSFLAVAELLNVAPEKVLVIGDRDDTDGEGARASQMQFVKYPDNFNIINQIIDHA